MLAIYQKLIHVFLMSLLAAYATEFFVLLLAEALHLTCQLCSCYDDHTWHSFWVICT